MLDTEPSDFPTNSVAKKNATGYRIKALRYDGLKKVLTLIASSLTLIARVNEVNEKKEVKTNEERGSNHEKTQNEISQR